MRRRLIVMRHAKSSWHEGGGDDHSRPLNKRGQTDAPVIGNHLSELGWGPEVVFSSDSTRTRETLAGMLDQFTPTPAVEFSRALYHAGIHEIRDALATVADEVTTAMVLGHNPGWTHAVWWLSGKSVEMTTANAALLETTGDTWREALHGEGHWELIDVVRPKEL